MVNKTEIVIVIVNKITKMLNILNLISLQNDPISISEVLKRDPITNPKKANRIIGYKISILNIITGNELITQAKNNSISRLFSKLKIEIIESNIIKTTDIIKIGLTGYICAVKIFFEIKYMTESKINIGIMNLNIYLFVVFCILPNFIT